MTGLPALSVLMCLIYIPPFVYLSKPSPSSELFHNNVTDPLDICAYNMCCAAQVNTMPIQLAEDRELSAMFPSLHTAAEVPVPSAETCSCRAAVQRLAAPVYVAGVLLDWFLPCTQSVFCRAIPCGHDVEHVVLSVSHKMCSGTLAVRLMQHSLPCSPSMS